MERRKITKACFVGGFVCGLLAMILAPKFWWFGLTTGLAIGFISGYLAYDFKKVMQAVPIAWRRAKKGASENWSKLQAWLKKPHPLALMTVSGSLSLSALVLLTVPMLDVFDVFAVIISYVLGILLCLLLAYFFAKVGSEEVEKCYILWPSLTNDEKREKENLGLAGKPYTYRNFFRWTRKGTVRVLNRTSEDLLILLAYLFYFFLWKIWRIGIGFLGRFVWNLFRLVHSKKRLLCGIWGGSGGLLSVLWFGPQAQSPTGYLLVGLCGGLIGAALGLVDYEFVSVRLLKLAPKNS